MTTSGDTLEEALANGRGTERPFRCPSHDDTTASASVNVLKGVWFCHACHAKGAVDSKRVPKVDELLAMMEPERTAREYPEAWLETFLDWPTRIYWDTRFPRWVTWTLGMGHDPFTDEPTFPVHTAAGILAGVGRRKTLPPGEKGPRYLYPWSWSASVSLFGRGPRVVPMPVVVLVEGAADTAAVTQTGFPALGTYGAGLHLPQVEILAQHRPRLVLLGFDMDDAGERAVTRAFSQIGRMAELRRVYWGKNDPADTPLDERKRNLHKAVSASDYGSSSTTLHQHLVGRVEDMTNAFADHLKEIA